MLVRCFGIPTQPHLERQQRAAQYIDIAAEKPQQSFRQLRFD